MTNNVRKRIRSINHYLVNNIAKTLNSFWFIFNARKSKKKKKFSEQIGANMSFDVIAAVQKTTSVGLFLTLPQATHSKCKLIPPYVG
jgi:hypothetical protein